MLWPVCVSQCHLCCVISLVCDAFYRYLPSALLCTLVGVHWVSQASLLWPRACQAFLILRLELKEWFSSEVFLESPLCGGDLGHRESSAHGSFATIEFPCSISSLPRYGLRSYILASQNSVSVLTTICDCIVLQRFVFFSTVLLCLVSYAM